MKSPNEADHIYVEIEKLEPKNIFVQEFSVFV